jgi:hypothetical protein
MRYRFAAVLALASITGCSGMGNEPDPNLVHVANLAYIETSCGATTCEGNVRFQLLNSVNHGSAGVVLVGVEQPASGLVGVNAAADGWGLAPVTVNRTGRPFQILACPEGVPEGDRRCATTSTG